MPFTVNFGQNNEKDQFVVNLQEWKDKPCTKEDNPSGFVCESSFAVLFPKYREKYIKQVWAAIIEALSQHGIKGELDLVEGTMTVFTSKRAYDPYSIMNARDLIKLVSRGVPYEQAIRVLEDDFSCDLIKISTFCRKKDKFVKRRDRLVGKDGRTLKALELITNCYVLVQGRTVAAIGPYKGLRQVRSVVEDCMKNIHPAFSIKTLMIKKELENDPKLKNENWERFLPKLKRNPLKKEKKKKKNIKKKDGPRFPPEPTPSKVDIELETGVYFMNERERRKQKWAKKQEKQSEVISKKKQERAKAFIPPKEK
ncbi:hypothetical protein ACOME3_001888 [Neoechinorhynchus agilis]